MTSDDSQPTSIGSLLNAPAKPSGASRAFSEAHIRASEARKVVHEKRAEDAERARKRDSAIALIDASGAGERHKIKRADELLQHKQWWQALERARGVINANGILALLSPRRGNGKTQMAVELIRSCCHQLKPARYVRAAQLFMEAKETFDGPGRESQVLERYVGTHLLVIDELQQRSDTEYERHFLSTLIDMRYVDLKPTVLVANLDSDGFAQHVGASITDRIIEGGGYIEFDWPSFRVGK